MVTTGHRAQARTPCFSSPPSRPMACEATGVFCACARFPRGDYPRLYWNHAHASPPATRPSTGRTSCCRCEARDMRAARRSGARLSSREHPMATAAAGRQPSAAIELLLRHAPGERPGARGHGRSGAQAPAGRDRADRLGEHRLARRAGGGRHRPHQQVCGRLSGQPLLRRLPVRGRGRDAGHRARQEAVQVQVRQRAAALGQRPPTRRRSWR